MPDKIYQILNHLTPNVKTKNINKNKNRICSYPLKTFTSDFVQKG
jgi:hypothetical protein